jgi:predicted dinucleotide-binding enzyme
LANGFIALGHDVTMGARERGNAKAVAWANGAGAHAAEGSFADAAEFAELVVLATLGSANETALRAAGIERLRGNNVIDTTNPLDFSRGFPPTLSVGHLDSAGEQVQRLLPESLVVKAFNTTGNANMFRPDFPGGPPTMFFCGNDPKAKATVSALLVDFGHQPADIGGIESSRYLEAMCMAWVLFTVYQKTRNAAFKMLTK